MKKTISVLLAIMMIMLSLLPTMVLAEERDKTYDVIVVDRVSGVRKESAYCFPFCCIGCYKNRSDL